MPQPSRPKPSDTEPPVEDEEKDVPEAPRMAFPLSDLLNRATAFFPDVPQARASLAGATHGESPYKELTLVQARELIEGWRPQETQLDKGA